ncbi:MAG: hypothetical protein NTW86_24890, partial [Candidatus Sumerlaeota bacterium]|nr:hypothetical protein [Candidatus Sumerlaeota bacterium]
VYGDDNKTPRSGENRRPTRISECMQGCAQFLEMIAVERGDFVRADFAGGDCNVGVGKGLAGRARQGDCFGYQIGIREKEAWHRGQYFESPQNLLIRQPVAAPKDPSCLEQHRRAGHELRLARSGLAQKIRRLFVLMRIAIREEA